MSSILDSLSNVLNMGSQMSSNYFNSLMAMKQFEYQKSLQQDIFNREDTAYQRRVADMEAAGINKYSITGGSGAGSVVSTNAPRSEAINYKLQNIDYMSALSQLEAQHYQTENLKLANNNLIVDNRIKNELAENTEYMNRYRRLMAEGQWLYDSGHRGLQYDSKKGFTWDSRASKFTENISSLDKAFGQREFSQDLLEENITGKEKSNKLMSLDKAIKLIQAISGFAN